MSPLFSRIKNAVLGKNYDLSVALITPAAMRRVMKYKKMNSTEMRALPTSNVLSFPLSKNSGEILLCRSAAKPFSVEYLFVHGLLHLKGFKHGATMERKEHTLCAGFHVSKNSNRSGHRHLPSKGGHRRNQ